MSAPTVRGANNNVCHLEWGARLCDGYLWVAVPLMGFQCHFRHRMGGVRRFSRGLCATRRASLCIMPLPGQTCGPLRALHGCGVNCFLSILPIKIRLQRGSRPQGARRRIPRDAPSGETERGQPILQMFCYCLNSGIVRFGHHVLVRAALVFTIS